MAGTGVIREETRCRRGDPQARPKCPSQGAGCRAQGAGCREWAGWVQGVGWMGPGRREWAR